MKKLPKCKICDGRHYSYQCWQKPRKPIKYRSNNASKIDSKGSVVSKRHNLSSKPKSNRKTLVKRLDEVTSKYVRLYYADKRGEARCYTCGVLKNWKELDCAHFIKRGNIHTRFDLDNLRVCCQKCNRYLAGNYEIYEKKLRKELGEDKYNQLMQKSQQNNKISTVELEILLDERKKLLKDVENSKKV